MNGILVIHPIGRKAFTLVEMLAAMTVLVLILVMLGQVFSDTVRATTGSRKQIEATRAARTVLDTLRDDLDNVVVAHDAGTVFAKADGSNGELTFITRRRGPQGGTAPRYLAVRYAMEGTDLVRNVSPVDWTDADLMDAASTGPSDPAEPSRILARGILRFEVMVQLADGRVVPLRQEGPWRSNTWHASDVPENYFAFRLRTSGDASSPAEEVHAITVGIAVVDEQSLALPGVDTMGGVLEPAGVGETPLERWNKNINDGALSTFPAPATSALRIFQSTFSLP